MHEEINQENNPYFYFISISKHPLPWHHFHTHSQFLNRREIKKKNLLMVCLNNIY